MSNSNGTRKAKPHTLLTLPLSASLAHHLTPDSLYPNVSSVIRDYPRPETYKNPPGLTMGDEGFIAGPSYLRRSRQVRGGAHFTYVTPLLTEFPYKITPPRKASKRKVDGEAVGDGPKAREVAQGTAEVGKEGSAVAAEEQEAEDENEEPPPQIDIEEHLGSLEPSISHPYRSKDDVIRAYTSPARASSQDQPFSPARLLAISPAAAEACFPEVDFDSAEGRDAVTDVLSGRLVIARVPGVDGEQDRLVKEKGWAPYSLCYGGHQFGVWASQLGDGRAITVLTTQLPPGSPDPFLTSPQNSSSPSPIELQLKGAGRTPYSRFADGLAVLRSSVREFLGAEAAFALGIPTSRVLGLVSLPKVEVQREQTESAAVVGRVAPSWVRIGNFELQKVREEWDSLARLVRYAAGEVFGFELERPSTGKSAYVKQEEGERSVLGGKLGLAELVLREVAARNAKMVAAWQVHGFMHGVMNTDNISICGITIDFGPYAFMDVFSPMHICNHSDGEGRYSYRMQPTMTVWAVQKLGSALSEAIGYELDKGQPISDGWAKDATSSQLAEWRAEGEKVVEIVVADFVDVFLPEYKRLMLHRLGLSSEVDTDFHSLISKLLDMMEQHELDYSHTFRTLCNFRREPVSPSATSLGSSVAPSERPISSEREVLLTQLIPDNHTTTAWKGREAEGREKARKEWHAWLGGWEDRIATEEKQHGPAPGTTAESDFAAKETARQAMLRQRNPRFVLRQWVLEDTIAALRKDEEGSSVEGGEREGERLLKKVLSMAEKPFESYGEDAEDSTPGAEEERRLCGMGRKEMLGFQCSCSS